MKTINAMRGGGAIWVACAVSVWLMAVSPGTAADAPFTAGELKRFISDSVPYCEWISTGRHERVVARLTENPKFVAEFPEGIQLIRDRGWEPRRFAYVFNHVLVAHKMLGMGGEPSRLVARLEATKASVQKEASQSDSDKARMLAVIGECQREAQQTEKRFAALPAEEVRIMWMHRAELRKLLQDNLRLKPRVLPNLGTGK